MKVVMQDTKKIVEVKPGYALNYLIPQGLAVLATDVVIKQYAQEQQENEKQKEKEDHQREAMIHELEGKIFTMIAKANQAGELYGAIGKQQIKKKLKIKDKIVIKLEKPIKKIGQYPIEIKLGKYKTTIQFKIKTS